jgi:hypothetical protein
VLLNGYPYKTLKRYEERKIESAISRPGGASCDWPLDEQSLIVVDTYEEREYFDPDDKSKGPWRKTVLIDSRIEFQEQ